MAAKYVQQWIQDEAEKVDTSSNFSEDDTEPDDYDAEEPTDDTELDGQFSFTDDSADEPDDDADEERYHEDAQKITEILKQQHHSTLIGYMTLTLQAMGMNAETISDAQLMMYQILNTKSDEEAREAYKGE